MSSGGISASCGPLNSRLIVRALKKAFQSPERLPSVLSWTLIISSSGPPWKARLGVQNYLDGDTAILPNLLRMANIVYAVSSSCSLKSVVSVQSCVPIKEVTLRLFSVQGNSFVTCCFVRRIP